MRIAEGILDEPHPAERALSGLGTAALELAKAGLRCFPIRPRQKAPPLVRGGFKAAITDPDMIVRWWRVHPQANIGIRTGDGLAVLDVDPRSGGEPPTWLPKTLTARTPSGGVHLYFRVDGPVKCSAGVLAPGLDIRGDGGYVLAAPSVLAHGRYEWEIPIRPMAEVSAAVLQGTRTTSRASGSGGRSNGDREPFRPRENVRKGERHDELVRWAGWLRSQGYDRDEIEEVLLAVNAEFAPPLDDLAEIERVAEWAGRLPS